MYIERIETAGFAGLPDAHGALSLERFAQPDLGARAAVAVADAIQLCFAACDPSVLEDLLARWGCEGVKVLGDGLPEGAEWARAPGMADIPAATAAPGLGGVVSPTSDGRLQSAVTLALDPPQYRMLRANAARDTRLVDALSDGARLTLRVGARFSPGWDGLGLDLLGLAIGGTSFPVAGTERPSWVVPLLRGLRGRAARGAPAHHRWALRAGSWDARDQHALRRATRALAEPPFAVGQVVVLPEGPAVLEDTAVVALSRLGPAASAAVGLVGAVFLEGSDVLLVEALPADARDAWTEWLRQQAEADGSPLEQVILLG